MATTTTRLALTKPGYADTVDIADINNNMDTIDESIGANVCTSITRPASPYTGQLILETDTNNAYIWNGSSWKKLGGGGGGLGHVLLLMGA